MAQKGEGHSGDGVGTLQHTSVRAQPLLANWQLTLLHRSEGGGQVGQCMACVILIYHLG